MIRLSEARDIPDILNLLLQVGKVHSDIRPDIFLPQPCKYDADALQVLMQDKNRPIFVYEQDGHVAGYAFCILEETRGSSVLTDKTELYIDDLCVDAACRGKHIGSRLYDHVLAYAREIGCDFVTLNVWEGNDSARKFYESKGLRPRNTHMEIPVEKANG